MRTAWRETIAMGMAAGLLLGTAACSSTRRAEPTIDAGVDQGGSMNDAPVGDGGGGCTPASQIYCTRGAPVSPGGPIACSDVSELGICVGGVWTCPPGTALNPNCNCNGAPPHACNVCTFQGWSCPDAGPPDAGRPDTGQQCPSANPGPSCVSGSGTTGAVVCDDVAVSPLCSADGSWTCPAGRIPDSSCNCFYPPFCSGCSSPFTCGATCGPHGWICPSAPDAGAPDAAPTDAGAHG